MWLILLPMLGGCGGAIVGDWHLLQATPNRETFSIDDATFRRDGTFTAATTIDGVTTRDSGRYEFVGYRLTLRLDAGGQRSYPTTLRLGRLEISDRNRKAVLKKGRKGE